VPQPVPAVRPQPTEAGDPGRRILVTASSRLRRAVPFDAAGWFAVDPGTLLPTCPVLIENVEPGRCEDYWLREGTVEDVTLFRDLARHPTPAATLLSATGGNPRRSARYRDYLEPNGFADELRIALRVGDRTWGVAVLMRTADRPAFSRRDVDRAVAAGPAVAAALAALNTAQHPDDAAGGPDCPGVAVYTGWDAPPTVDAQARRWLTELAGTDWVHDRTFRTTATALISRADAVAAGRDGGPATIRVRTRTGRWLALHASRQQPLSDPRTPDDAAPAVIVVGPAAPTQVAPLLAGAYGLSPREQEVTAAVARGLSTADAARELHMSPHTVRDHLKAIFGKLGVSSRGELVARLFADRALPALVDPAAHTTAGVLAAG